MNRRQTFAFFYGLRRQHKPPFIAAAIAAWYALRPTKF